MTLKYTKFKYNVVQHRLYKIRPFPTPTTIEFIMDIHVYISKAYKCKAKG